MIAMDMPDGGTICSKDLCEVRTCNIVTEKQRALAFRFVFFSHGLFFDVS